MTAVRDRQLHFVTGKGGVGKSVVACALAMHWAKQYQRVLLVQINAKDSHAQLLKIPPVTATIQPVSGSLHVVNIDPRLAMKEYVMMTLKVEAVYRAVFENRVTERFLGFLPALHELTTMGKLWFHCEQQNGAGRLYDRIVVDLPASGHAFKLLQTSSMLTDAVRTGPMADKTRAMHAVFSDVRRTAVHVVATPEELPINEGLELWHRLHSSQLAPLGMFVVNRCVDALAGPHADRLLTATKSTPALRGLVEQCLFEEQQQQQQRKRVQSLPWTEVRDFIGFDHRMLLPVADDLWRVRA
jgi:anion-transporting  ArsA/GET3 family ATPase